MVHDVFLMDQDKNKGFSKGKWLLSLGAAGVILLLAIGLTSPGEEVPPNTLVVQKGDMEITITEFGDVKAVNPYAIVNDYRYSTKVIFALPEGSMVKEGDLIMEFDYSDIDERLESYRFRVEEALFDLEQSKKQLEISRSTIEADLRSAELVLEFAALDLRQYEEGTWPQQLRDYKRAITEAREKLIVSEEQLAFAEQFHEQGFDSRSTVEKKRMEVNKLKNALEKAEMQRKMAVEYNHPVKVQKFRRALEEAQADLERIGFETSRSLALAQSKVKTREYSYLSYKDKLEWYESQYEATKIRAPRSGMLVYPMDRYNRGRELIEEGSRVYWQQTLATIPDYSDLKVSISVHESMVHRLEKGQDAELELDLFPGRRFKGTVSKISPVPDSRQSYYQPNLRTYITEIRIEEPIPDAKPGMNATVHIPIDELRDVITVPAESVTTSNGQTVAFKWEDGEVSTTPVVVGAYDEEAVEIIRGLSEGDIILENAPFTNPVQDTAPPSPEDWPFDSKGNNDVTGLFPEDGRKTL